MEILLLSTNPEESALLRLAFQRLGLTVRITTDFEEMVTNWQSYNADIITLAFAKRELPIRTIRRLRTFSDVPLVVISEVQIEEQHVYLLDSGVDLVVFRPYSTRLLMAQLRALLRRAAGVPLFSLPMLTQGEIRLDPTDRTVQVQQENPRRLTQLEFRLLYTLMSNSGRVISAERLVEHVWGYNGRGDRDLVRGLIKRLRAKVEPAPQKPRFIITIPGLGYKFSSQQENM